MQNLRAITMDFPPERGLVTGEDLLTKPQKGSKVKKIGSRNRIGINNLNLAKTEIVVRWGLNINQNFVRVDRDQPTSHLLNLMKKLNDERTDLMSSCVTVQLSSTLMLSFNS
jgi:hypothetical protein